tara:strand:- start:846 stop:1055 length:210 start_codon:yes stop_codon:yes gene_type:complete
MFFARCNGHRASGHLGDIGTTSFVQDVLCIAEIVRKGLAVIAVTAQSVMPASQLWVEFTLELPALTSYR